MFQYCIFYFIVIISCEQQTGNKKIPEAYATNDTVLIVFEKARVMAVMCRGDEKPPLRHLFQLLPTNRYNISSFTSWEIFNCTSRETSIATLMATGDFDVGVIEKLHILTDNEPPLSAEFLRGLSIKSLKISVVTVGAILQPTADFLEPLHSTLTELEVRNTNLSPLPVLPLLKKITLRQGTSLNDFGDCSTLRELDIIDWEVQVKRWLANCTKLVTLNLKKISTNVVKRLLEGASVIESLTIKQSNLQCMGFVINACPSLFSANKKLKYLTLTDNKITYISQSAFITLTSLQELDLSGNKMTTGFDFIPALSYQRDLTKLSLSRNGFQNNLCTYLIIPGIKWPLKLKRLVLKSIGATEICVKEMVGNSIQYLDLTDNNIQTLDLQYNSPKLYGKLPITRNVPLIVDLRNNPIKKIFLNKSQYNYLQMNYLKLTRTRREITNVTLLVNISEIACDCNEAFLARALRAIPSLAIPGLQCQGGKELRQMPLDSLDCDMQECALGCLCRRWWIDGAVDANCTDLATIPPIPFLRTLHAQGGRIKTLNKNDLPSSLKYLDISENKVQRVNAEVAKALFSEPKRAIRLAGNPIACDCENRALLSVLQAQNNRVEDYENATCFDGRRIFEVDVQALCKSELHQKRLAAILGTCVTLALLMLITLAFYNRYKHQIHIFLYNRGWCNYPLEDEDRLYDVFIAFSHMDESLVVDELLPELEKEPHSYSVCVHYRNWIAGEWIPAQIARSVQQSRRTLIVVSEKFLDSMWGLLEFRTAMMCSTRENRPRVIIVLLDESVVQDERMDPELRAYISSNTYLCWGDPWFWDKLRYALPVRNPCKKPAEKNKTDLTPSQRSSYDIAITFSGSNFL